jgi:hypothetical protein
LETASGLSEKSKERNSDYNSNITNLHHCKFIGIYKYPLLFNLVLNVTIFVHALFIHSSIQLFQTDIRKGIILCGRDTTDKYAACPLIKLINTILNMYMQCTLNSHVK